MLARKPMSRVKDLAGLIPGTGETALSAADALNAALPGHRDLPAQTVPVARDALRRSCRLMDHGLIAMPADEPPEAQGSLAGRQVHHLGFA